MIRYEQIKPELHAVFLDGRRCGKIKKVDGLWYYFPKGSNGHGDGFRMLSDCKLSLED